jgi:iron(III) transport system ATP-binding protein
MSAELKVERLGKRFGPTFAAVDDVTFRAEAGEIVVLLGPSGCGKTTTLRCVAGLEHPTSGVISVGGEVVSAPERGILMPSRQRDMGMVFQSYAVWPHMTVRQNVEYPLRHRGVSRAERDGKVAEVLDLVGLSDYADRPVVVLSGGQMQRVALARSLVYSPRVLLLDEPLSNLDAKLRLRLRDDLRRIIKQTGVTALYVTHDQSEAVVLGDRIGVMRKGKLLQMATAEELYNRPADLFVANFTGASNQMQGRLLARHGSIATIRTEGGDLQATLPAAFAEGAAVDVAMRPENILIGASAAGASNAFPARIEATRYLGTQTVYDLRMLGAVVQVVELGTAPRYPVGAEIQVSIPPDQCWAYPAGTPVD